MKTRLKTVLLAGVTSLTASAALAQQAELPTFLTELDGIQFQGQMSGLDIYSMEGFEGIWMVSPDGRTAIAGTVFSNDGRDIGAAFTGGSPVRSFEVTPGTKLPPESVAPVSDDAGISVIPEGDFLTSEELDEMEAGVSRIENQVMTPETAPVDAIAINPADVTKDARAALEGLSEEDKETLMVALVELLRDVKNEVEFQSAVKVWTEEVVRRHKSGENLIEVPAEHSSEAGQSTHDTDAEQVAAVEPASQEVAVQESASTDLVLETPEETIADQLLDEVRTDAMWFGIGKMDAPVAYAFIDPTCPYCAKTIANLEGAVASGDLQLRIILAPVLSERSGQFISSILMAEEPPIAFLEHELGMSRGRSPLTPGKWEDIPGNLRDSLIHNAQIMKDYEIRGVPFLVFDTDEGAKVINGVPSAEALATALPDAYRGNK